MDAEFYEGRRLSYNGALCTVRFAGEVAGTKGTWLGVEWDDPQRGKHAGQHNGTKYFHCASTSPTAASFIRPDRPADTPQSYTQALKHKYAAAHPAEDAVRISGKEVQEVGFDKVAAQLANLRALRIAILDGQCIARPGARAASRAGGYGSHALDGTDVGDVSPAVVDLDLSRNLLEQWDEVLDVARQLPALVSLRIDGNRFRVTVSSRVAPGCLPEVRSLGMSETLTRWADVLALPAIFPKLETLSLNKNEFSTLSGCPSLESLTSIDLERNQFESLEQIMSLAKLSSLKRLNLKANRISRSVEPKESLKAFSRGLDDVDLSYNNIDNWEFINSLAMVFPGMTSLRVSHNPLYNDLKASDGRALTADDGYMLTLARLGGLQKLNFSNITNKDRLNSETYYLSQIVAELSRSSDNEESKILAQHPRYNELSDTYGRRQIDRSAKVATGENVLAARLITCTFKPAPSVIEYAGRRAVNAGDDAFILEIPRSFTIYNTLGLVGRHLNIKPMLLKLFLVLDSEKDEEQDSDDPEGSDGSLDGSLGVMSDTNENLLLKEEILIPKMRNLGKWIEGHAATIRVEMSELDVRRNEAAHGIL